jgi:hypothetical protein
MVLKSYFFYHNPGHWRRRFGMITKMSLPPIKIGLVFTLIVLALMEALARTGRPLLFPGPFWELVVIHAALIEGLLSGLVSAALTILYAAYALALPDHYLMYGDEGVQRLLTQCLVGPGLAVLVAYSRRKRPG